MAKEAGSSQPRTGAADHATQRMMKSAASLSPLGIMHHATKHASAAVTFTQKLSQTRDLHDRMRIHTEHTQMHIDLFKERAKELSDAMEVFSNFVNAVASQLRMHKQLGEVTTKAFAEKPADEEGQTPGSRSKR